MKIPLAAFLLGCAIMAGAVRANDRTVVHGVRVPDGGIVVDGRAGDWNFAFPSPGYVMSAADASHFNPVLMRGTWNGPDDLSYRVTAATDSRYLYLLCVVRDSLLYNGGDEENPIAPWRGDDVEVYIDANPPSGRFQKSLNENTEQFIFVPEHLWAGVKGTPIWGAGNFAGVRAASRLTPTGYVMEVAIPKADFPNWKAHPDMDSIGFDMMVGDIDSPGVIGHDPGEKLEMFLLDTHPHFERPANLSLLQFEQKAVPSENKQRSKDDALPGYAEAQSILDRWDEPGIEKEANKALAGPRLARKAALFLFYRRPDLSPDIGALVAALKARPGGKLFDGRPYAMLALAERHKLPAAEFFDAYAQNDDPDLAQAFLYALGVNGDKSIVPRLAKIYPTAKGYNGYTKDIIAVSLAELGDRTGVPTLEASGFGDTEDHQPFARKCRALLQTLGITRKP